MGVAPIVELSAEEIAELGRTGKTFNALARIVGTHVATVYRWADRGIGGAFLKTYWRGGTRMSTEAWVAEFFQDVQARKAAQTSGGRPEVERPVAPTPTPAARKRQERAERRARDLGLM